MNAAQPSRGGRCRLGVGVAQQCAASVRILWRQHNRISIKFVFSYATAYDVDSSIANNITEHIASREPLPYHVTTIYNREPFLSKAKFSIQLQRASTRLKQVYCVIHRGSVGNTPINDFYHQLGATAPSIANDNLDFQLTIGSRKWPERFVQGSAKTYMRLRHAPGQFFSGDASMSCTSLGSNFTKGRAIHAIELDQKRSSPHVWNKYKRGRDSYTRVQESREQRSG